MPSPKHWGHRMVYTLTPLSLYHDTRRLLEESERLQERSATLQSQARLLTTHVRDLAADSRRLIRLGINDYEQR
jgi:hypothetical protein